MDLEMTRNLTINVISYFYDACQNYEICEVKYGAGRVRCFLIIHFTLPALY